MRNKNIFQSFKNAFEGLRYTFLEHRNFRILAFFAFLVIILAFYLTFNLSFSLEKWLVLILLISVILSLELLNTAIEFLANHLSGDQYDPHIKIIKDISASAVLLISLFSIILGFLLFLNP
jgi:diacylglycerol kinase